MTAVEGNDSTSNQGKKTLSRIKSVILTKKIKTSNLVGKRLYFEILLQHNKTFPNEDSNIKYLSFYT